jgi:simple sugar transport system permease protein
MEITVIVPLLAAAIQMGTPILYATLGEIIAEKSGVLNLGVEGMMVVGALTAFVVAQATGSPWLGFVAGGVGASLLAAVHGTVCLVFMGNQVVSGLALTIFGAGLGNYLGTPLVGKSAPGFSTWHIPYLSDIPVLGRVLFQHDVLIYISFVLPAVIWVLWKRTRLGLAIEAAGENPQAAGAAGLNVLRLRWLGTLTGGFLAGLGGAYLSLSYTHLWTNGLSAGRGWIAVALVIFAFWHPGRAVLGAYLFGGVMAFQLRLQASGTNLPSSLLLVLPYALTVLVLVFSSLRGGRSAGPASLGVTREPEG